MLGVRLLLGSVVVVLGAQSIAAYRRATLLPTRLTAFAVVLVLASTAVMGGVSTLRGALDARQRIYAHLETNTVLQQGAITSWANRLNGVLDALVSPGGVVTRLLDGQALGDELQVYGEAAEQLRSEFQRTQALQEIALADARGYVLVSTDSAREGSLFGSELTPIEDGERLAPSPNGHASASGGGSITFMRPLVRDGETLGVLLGWADLTELLRIAHTGPGDTPIATHVVGPDFALLTEPRGTEGVTVVHSEAIDAVVRERASVPGRASYVSHSGVPVLGVYVWDPDLQIGIVSEVPTAEALAVGRSATLVQAGVAVLAALVAGAMAYAVAQDVVQPLSMLSDAALSIADGDLDQVVEVACDDEVGALAESFNVMSAQLQDVVGGLNRRLRIQSRALQAVTEASELAGSATGEDGVLQSIVDLVQERFALAYVGLFLLDEELRYAVLRAATGEVGATMLASGWRLLCGGESMIGQCVATGESLVSQHVGVFRGASSRIAASGPFDLRQRFLSATERRVLGAMDRAESAARRIQRADRRPAGGVRRAGSSASARVPVGPASQRRNTDSELRPRSR